MMSENSGAAAVVIEGTPFQISDNADIDFRYKPESLTDDELDARIRQAQTVGGYAVVRLAMHVAYAGRDLLEFKRRCGHGNFLDELKRRHPEISERAAQLYMQMWSKLKANPQLIADLKPTKAYKLLGIVKDNGAHVAHNGGENEWYTPPEYIQAARTVMGAIDCDPASTEVANETVGASVFYSAEDDGLAQAWGKRVWMNPPYAQPLISLFSQALVDKAASGEVKEACILVNNATETAWFQSMMQICSAVCFVKSRVRFLDPEGNPGAPLQGQAVIYIGNNTDTFYHAYKTFGTVLFNG